MRGVGYVLEMFNENNQVAVLFVKSVPTENHSNRKLAYNAKFT